MSTAGPLAEAARRLAGSHAASPGGAPRHGFRRRLRRLQRTLDRALPVLAESPPPDPGAGAAEWLLDNAYLLAEALAQVRETLTPGFLRHLPVLAAPAAGEPRIHAVARELVREGDGHFDPDRAKRFLDAYDPVPAVTMGELWALPAMLRLVLLEELAGAADVYGVAPHTGRRGCNWYTGSAAWLWRLGVEAILGLQRRGDVLLVDPCIPSGWREYEVTYRFGRSAVHVRVENPDGASEGVAAVQLDGATLPDLRIPLVDEGGEHQAVVRRGGPVAAVLTSRPAVAAARA